MNKSVVTIATATSFLLVGGIAQASVRGTSIKPTKLTSKSTYWKGSATKLATIKLSRYHTTYAYGKANSKGKFNLKLKHKLHANWKYRLTVTKKGYKTTTTYVKSTKYKATPKTTPVSTSSNTKSTNSNTSTTNVKNVTSNQLVSSNKQISNTIKNTSNSSGSTSAPSTINTGRTSSSSKSVDTSTSPAKSATQSTSSDTNSSKNNPTQTNIQKLNKQLDDLITLDGQITNKLDPMKDIMEYATQDVTSEYEYKELNESLSTAETSLAKLDSSTSSQIDLLNANNNVDSIKDEIARDHAEDVKIENAITTVNSTPNFANTYESLTKEHNQYTKQIQQLEHQLDPERFDSYYTK